MVMPAIRVCLVDLLKKHVTLRHRNSAHCALLLVDVGGDRNFLPFIQTLDRFLALPLY